MAQKIKIQVCTVNSSGEKRPRSKRTAEKTVWRAYVNDGVELTEGEGCRTKAAAIKVCKEDRKLVMMESSDGSDMGLEYYIEQERIADDEIIVLQTIPLQF